MVDSRALLADLWPPAAVVVRTPRLELRWPSMDDLVALANVAGEGVHDEDKMPFYTPWTRGSALDRARSVLRWNWKGWGEWDPAKWSWGAVTVVDGVVVGTQGMEATDYAVCRTVETGSWLGQAHQGQGIGKEMRAAMLHLACRRPGRRGRHHRRLHRQRRQPGRHPRAGLPRERLEAPLRRGPPRPRARVHAGPRHVGVDPPERHNPRGRRSRPPPLRPPG